jgi:hypothetical protein
MFRGDLSAGNGAGPNIKPFVGGLMPGGSGVSNVKAAGEAAERGYISMSTQTIFSR